MGQWDNGTSLNQTFIRNERKKRKKKEVEIEMLYLRISHCPIVPLLLTNA